MDKQEEVEEDEIVEDNEVTRCVCGNQDYPGPPIVDDDAEDLSEDVGGLFIQCDSCSVWQHGGCVGIMDDSMTPENYYCEECRPDFHKIFTNEVGQQYSRYTPVCGNRIPKPSHRKGSASKDAGRSKRDKETSRPSAETFSKRRSTMNSRAAYDEEEALKRALEESKNEGHQSTENGNRKGKRARAESEEYAPFDGMSDTTTYEMTVRPRPDAKRLRVASEPDSEADSDTEMQSPDPEQGKGNTARKQMARGAAARSQREKELRDREKDRADAANKRKRRADQRRDFDDEGEYTNPMDIEGNLGTVSGLSATPRRSSGMVPILDSKQHPIVNFRLRFSHLDAAKTNGKDAADNDGTGSLPPDTPSASGSLVEPGKKKPGPKRGRGRVVADTPTERGEGSPARGKNGKASASPKDVALNGGGGDASGTETAAAAAPNGAGRRGKAGSDREKAQGSKEMSWAEMRRRTQLYLDNYAVGEAEIKREEAVDESFRTAGLGEAWILRNRVEPRERVRMVLEEGRAKAEAWMTQFGGERDRPARGGGGGGGGGVSVA